MYELAAQLPETAIILDLGSGGGSFDYSRTRAAVISADLAFPEGAVRGAGALAASAVRLPLRNESIDLVVCNHTLEHFPELPECIGEIARVLKRNGYLWAAVPDGWSLDDRLYRFLFKGGGHLNQFSFDSFLEAIQGSGELRAASYKRLRSGFVYLKPPSASKLRHFPLRAKVALGLLPARLQMWLVRWFNLAVRVLDRRLSTQWSYYGWAVSFQKQRERQAAPSDLETLPEDSNVCFGCGSGHATATLQRKPACFGLLTAYACPACGTVNFLVEP